MSSGKFFLFYSPFPLLSFQNDCWLRLTSEKNTRDAFAWKWALIKVNLFTLNLKKMQLSNYILKASCIWLLSKLKRLKVSFWKHRLNAKKICLPLTFRKLAVSYTSKKETNTVFRPFIFWRENFTGFLSAFFWRRIVLILDIWT